MSQSRRHSAIEAVANVAVGYCVSIAAQIVIFPWFNIHIAFGSDLAIGGAFTVVSLVRSFALRRAFNAWHSAEGYAGLPPAAAQARSPSASSGYDPALNNPPG